MRTTAACVYGTGPASVYNIVVVLFIYINLFIVGTMSRSHMHILVVTNLLLIFGLNYA